MTEASALAEVRAARRLHFTRRPRSIPQTEWWQPEGSTLTAWEIERMVAGARRGRARHLETPAPETPCSPIHDENEPEWCRTLRAWSARVAAFEALTPGTEV